jgi:cytochrome c peroxidase
VFKIECAPGAKTAFHGSTVVTNDPGKALITGKCADVGRFTVAPLRGLGARAPYFSDGSAPELSDVVDFYDKRFSIGLSPQDKADLVHFLSSL